MDLGLKGKVAMVAGAYSGLGFAVARQLAAEGASVSLGAEKPEVAESAERIARETGAPVHAGVADVRSREAIEAWHRATVEKFGGVDLLFTNSGGPPPGGFANFDDKAWQDGFELLVLSVVRMIRAVSPSIAARGGGAILCSTSSSVKEPIANLTLSNVLRASVGALCKTLATELAGQNVRVNQIMPGRIATDRIRSLDEAAAKRQGLSVDEVAQRSRANIPLGRYGEPGDYGRAAAFLLSPAAGYITGATLQVDGGMIRYVL